MRMFLLPILLIWWAGSLAQDRVADREAKVRAWLLRGKAYKAIAQCDAMLGAKPEPRFHVLRAEALNRIGEHEKALRDAHAAVHHFPGLAEAYHEMGVAEQGLGMVDSAKVHLRWAITLKDRPDTRQRLAAVLMMGADHAGALAQLDTAARALPAGAAALAGVQRARGECLAAMGDTVAARVAFDQALAIAPDDPVTYNSRGWFLHALHGQHAAAVADYDRAIRLNPNYSYAFNNRGWSRYRMGEVEKGLADIEKARRRKVFNPYIYRNLGIIALERGERQRACEQFRKALAYGFTERFGNEVKDLAAAACTGSDAGLTPVQAPNAPLSTPSKNTPVRNNAP